MNHMFWYTDLLDIQDNIIAQTAVQTDHTKETSDALAKTLQTQDGYYDSIGERHSYNNLQKISIKHFKYNELYPV